MGYYPCIMITLTRTTDRGGRQCQVGSLTGAVASQKITEAPKGSLRMVGNHSQSVKAQASLTARQTGRAGTKVGLSDPVVPHGRAIAQRIKATLGITGLSPQESIDGEVGTSMSAHRILASRSCGWAIRPLKRSMSWVQNVETVRSLSVAGVGNLRGPVLSTG